MQVDFKRRTYFRAGLLACMAVMPKAFASEGLTTVSRATWQQALELAFIPVRTNKNDRLQAIIFFDPNCPYCANLWKRLYEKDSPHRKSFTRWVPVAYMNGRSMGMSAALLESQSVSLLERNFTEFDIASRQGGAPEVAVSSEINSQLQRSRRLWEQLGAGTPLTIYLSKDGLVRAQMGLLPEPNFSAMVKSWQSVQLSEYR